MSAAQTPSPPAKPRIPRRHPSFSLLGRVEEALYAIPRYFDSETVIEGIEAQDLFSLNSVLGSTIEVQVVRALNLIRDTWDPPKSGQTTGDLAEFGFVRMPQSYPDVRLQRDTEGGPEVELGIELKGWYLLSKEKEPSYRFKATPNAASEVDLLVVVPWHLSNVLSGSPVVLKPFIAPARWAAEYRNWYWQYKRENPKKRPTKNRGVVPPAVDPPPPYPAGKQEMSDKPVEDSGNFGRLSRAGVMADYITETLKADIAGVAAADWIAFFSAFGESRTPADIASALARMGAAQALASAEDPAIQLVEQLRDYLLLVGAASSPTAGESEKEQLMTLIGEVREQQTRLLKAAGSQVETKELARAAGLTKTQVENRLQQAD